MPLKWTRILLLMILFLTGCVMDSSPLKSDLEVRINHMFGTDFDYLDRMDLYRWDAVRAAYHRLHTLT